MSEWSLRFFTHMLEMTSGSRRLKAFSPRDSMELLDNFNVFNLGRDGRAGKKTIWLLLRSISFSLTKPSNAPSWTLMMALSFQILERTTRYYIISIQNGQCWVKSSHFFQVGQWREKPILQDADLISGQIQRLHSIIIGWEWTKRDWCQQVIGNLPVREQNQ